MGPLLRGRSGKKTDRPQDAPPSCQTKPTKLANVEVSIRDVLLSGRVENSKAFGLGSMVASRHATAFALLALRVCRTAADLLELGPVAAKAVVAEAATDMLSALDRLAPTEQQRLIGAIACARAAGDALLRVACGEFELVGAPAEHRALSASSSSGSSGSSSAGSSSSGSGGSSSSSGSGGSGSGGGGSCPFKHDHHHTANRVGRHPVAWRYTAR